MENKDYTWSTPIQFKNTKALSKSEAIWKQWSHKVKRTASKCKMYGYIIIYAKINDLMFFKSNRRYCHYHKILYSVTSIYHIVISLELWNPNQILQTLVNSKQQEILLKRARLECFRLSKTCTQIGKPHQLEILNLLQ